MEHVNFKLVLSGLYVLDAVRIEYLSNEELKKKKRSKIYQI